MSTKRGNSRYVLAEDCTKAHGRIDLALWGEDGREGMVRDINEIKDFMKEQTKYREEEKEAQKEKRKNLLKWKFAAVGFAFALLGFVLQYALSKL